MAFDVVDTLLSLLANIDDRTITLHVLIDFDRNGLRDTHPRYRAKEIKHLVLIFCLREQRCHFLGREAWTTLLARVHARYADGDQVPLPVMDGIELLIQLRSDDPAKHTEIFKNALIGKPRLTILLALGFHPL